MLVVAMDYNCLSHFMSSMNAAWGAQQWIRKGIESDERNGMRFHLGLNHALYGDLFSRHRDRVQDQENLGKAIEILKECGADGWAEKDERELAKLT